MLPTTIDVNGPHIDAHIAMHRRYNDVLWAGDYISPGQSAAENDAGLAALLDMLVDAGGGRVELPPGTIQFSRPVVWPTPAVNVVLSGMGMTTRLQYLGDGIAWLFEGETPSNAQLVVHDLWLAGSDAGVGISLKNRGRVSMDSIWITDFETGLRLDGCLDSGFINVELRRDATGLHIRKALDGKKLDPNQNAFVNLKCHDNGRGIFVDIGNSGAGGIGFFGGLVQSNDEEGVYLHGGRLITFYNVWFENNHGEATVLADAGCTNCGLVACSMSNSGVPAIKLVAPGSHFHMQNSTISAAVLIGEGVGHTTIVNCAIPAGITDDGYATAVY